MGGSWVCFLKARNVWYKILVARFQHNCLRTCDAEDITRLVPAFRRQQLHLSSNYFHSGSQVLFIRGLFNNSVNRYVYRRMVWWLQNNTLACISKTAAVALFRTESKIFLENLRKATKIAQDNRAIKRSLTQEAYGENTLVHSITFICTKKARLALILC
jgi:hypothetical protein